MLPVMINDTRQMTVLDYTSVGVLSFSIFVNVSKKANADLQLLRVTLVEKNNFALAVNLNCIKLFKKIIIIETFFTDSTTKLSQPTLKHLIWET